MIAIFDSCIYPLLNAKVYNIEVMTGQTIGRGNRSGYGNCSLRISHFIIMSPGPVLTNIYHFHYNRDMKMVDVDEASTAGKTAVSIQAFPKKV